MVSLPFDVITGWEEVRPSLRRLQRGGGVRVAEVAGAPHCVHFGGNATLHFVGELLVLLLRDDVLAANVKQQSPALHSAAVVVCLDFYAAIVRYIVNTR